MADYNELLNTLDVTNSDKVIAIREKELADGNYILTSLMAKYFAEGDAVCLVILHNTVGHYHNVGKKLGFDFMKAVEQGQATTVEPMKTIVENIGNTYTNPDDQNYLTQDKEMVLRSLFTVVKSKVEELLVKNKHVHLIFDDLSHIMDLGAEIKYALLFVQYCTVLAAQDNVSLVMSTHVYTFCDEVLACSTFHIADLTVDVCPLKMGRSNTVSGVLKIRRPDNARSENWQSVYHYKLTDREIKIYAPGSVPVFG